MLGTGLYLWGYVKIEPSKPAEPEAPPEVEEPAELSYEKFKKWKQREKGEDEGEDDGSTEKEAQPLVDLGDVGDDLIGDGQTEAEQRRDRLKSLTEQLKGLFPSPDYSWEDVYETKCVSHSAYGCLDRDRVLQKKGVSRIIRKVVEDLSAKEAIERLETLVAVLEGAPVEKRGELIVPVVRAKEQIYGTYRRKVRERERKMERKRMEHRQKMQEYRRKIAKLEARKSSQRFWGMSSVGTGLAVVILVALFLVHFAIERHVRLLEELIDRREGVGGEAMPEADGSVGDGEV